MAITNFISTVWSENLYKELDKQYIAVANCNREFEGDIKDHGSVVKVCGVGSVTISNYNKNTDMSAPQTLSDTCKEIAIDRAKFFNFQIDDIDKAQASPNLMNAAMSVAASALANEADKYIYALHTQAGSNISLSDANEDNVINAIIDARQRLYENNVTDASNVVIEVSPAVAALILKAKVALASDNGDALEKGCLGSIGGCKVFVSNNIAVVDGTHKCIIRTTRAIAYAEQLSEIVAYRPEKRFADAIKGLHLYGASVIYPKEMVVLNVSFPAA